MAVGGTGDVVGVAVSGGVFVDVAIVGEDGSNRLASIWFFNRWMEGQKTDDDDGG